MNGQFFTPAGDLHWRVCSSAHIYQVNFHIFSRVMSTMQVNVVSQGSRRRSSYRLRLRVAPKSRRVASANRTPARCIRSGAALFCSFAGPLPLDIYHIHGEKVAQALAGDDHHGAFMTMPYSYFYIFGFANDLPRRHDVESTPQRRLISPLLPPSHSTNLDVFFIIRS